MKKRQIKSPMKIVVGIAAVVSLCSIASVHAQVLSDSVTVAGNPNPYFLPEDGTAQFLPAFFGPINAPDQYIQFNEPGTQMASDYLWIQAGYLYFESDAPQNVFPVQPSGPLVKVLDETGLPQEVSGYFQAATGVVLPPIQIVSDVTVPEPTTLVMGGLGGLAALLVSLRRK
jgi:hypothetical protein